MGDLRWLSDQQSFELEGVSTYHVTCDEAENSPGNLDRFSGFLNRLLREQKWKSYPPNWMLRTWVRLVALDSDQRSRGRVGVADVAGADSPGAPQPFGFIRVETDDPDEARDIASGVDRLYRFIDGHDVPLVCEAEIWLRETPKGGLQPDQISVTLPYEDEIYRTFHNYPSLLYSVRHGEADAAWAKELRARIGREEPPECRCELEWDGRSLVTVLPPGNPAFSPVANEDLGKVSAHFQESADRIDDDVPLVLIPRPDNEFDQKAVSVALPRAAGGSVQERHLAYLSHDYLGDSLGALIADLARFSGGEIQIHSEVIWSMPSTEVEPRLPPSQAFADAISAFLGDPGTPPVASRPALSTLLGVTEHRGLPSPRRAGGGTGTPFRG
ncbi:hypothetical protein [Citricoccus sp.]|uniref:hypothetical protein n=1 Tax=Citricoccus sp. TaxID=1978372 RepID=UPI0028BDAB25|nr:hypothetical protein [Citricoccus sp.]